MVPPATVAEQATARLREVEATLNDGAVGLGLYDALSGASWAFNGDRWFHAASVIKLAVLIGVYDGVARGRFTLDCRLHVRNRFLSAADGTPFRVDSRRDADAEVHAAIGRTMRLRELAHHMIVTSSNLATNLLLDLVGVSDARSALELREIAGVDLRRGVEDDRAFEQGITNRVTAEGVVAMLRVIVERRSFTPELGDDMLGILHAQEFSGTIIPGLPESVRSAARVAHKTGEISTVSHDAGVVFLPGRPPYIVAVLVESRGEARERIDAGTAASNAAYDFVAAVGEQGSR